MTQLAQSILERLTERLQAAADPVKATAMSAYMRDQFPFLGIPSPQLKVLSREVLAGTPKPVEDDLRALALGCWELPEREYAYFACQLLRRHIKVCGPEFLATVRYLIVNKSWWDTVDELAAHAVGPLVERYPQLVSTMDAWLHDENMWLIRTAILHQNRYREDTDDDRLFDYCTAQAGHTDFFIRKAIGWALREYAKSAPEKVRAYVRLHEAELSGLSKREALKHLGALS